MKKDNEGALSDSGPSVVTCGMGGPINPLSTAGPKFTGLMSLRDLMGWPGGISKFEHEVDMILEICGRSGVGETVRWLVEVFLHLNL